MPNNGENEPARLGRMESASPLRSFCQPPLDKHVYRTQFNRCTSGMLLHPHHSLYLLRTHFCACSAGSSDKSKSEIPKHLQTAENSHWSFTLGGIGKANNIISFKGLVLRCPGQIPRPITNDLQRRDFPNCSSEPLHDFLRTAKRQSSPRIREFQASLQKTSWSLPSVWKEHIILV